MNRTKQRLQRQKRTSQNVRRVGNGLRLRVFRSNQYIYAQIIDDKQHKMLLGVSEKHIADASFKEATKSKRAYLVGKLIATIAKQKKIKKIAFDRGSYAYHGRVRALAEGAREGGLQF